MDEDNKPDRLMQLTAQIEELEGTLRELIWRTYAIEQHLGLAPPPAPVFAPPPPVQTTLPPTVSAQMPETPPPQVPPPVPPPVPPLIVTPLTPGAEAPPPLTATVAASEAPRTIDRITKGRDLEALIGGNWFNRIGILAIILGSGFFLKYAFDNQWIGPSARVMIGFIIGIGFIGSGELFRKRDYRYYAHGFSGGGIAILYLTVFAAFSFYGLIGQVPAFLFMSLVTILAVLLAAVYDALAIAILGLLGGFLTPVLLSTGKDNQVGFFSYLILLNLGVLGLAYFKQWRILNYLTYGATFLLALAWMAEWYAPEKLWLTVTFFTILFVIYALLAVFHNIIHRRPASGLDILLIFVNASIYFAATYTLLQANYYLYLGLFAVLMSAFYLGLGYLTFSRDREDKYLILTFLGLASIFLTLAIPIQMSQHWVTMAWALEGAVLTWIGLRTCHRLTRYAALVVFGIAILHWFNIDLGEFAYREGSAFLPLFNRRGISSAILIASLAAAAWLYRRAGEEVTEKERQVIGGALAMGANVMALTWLSLDIRDYFEQLKTPFLARRSEDESVWFELARLDNLKHFSLTILWSIYGGVILLVGLTRRIQPLRASAFILFGLTVAKVLLFDARYYAAPWHTLIFNTTFGAFAVLIAMMAIGYWWYQRVDEIPPEERGWGPMILLATANLLAVIALSLEASGYFTVKMTASEAERAVSLASSKQFTLTTLWSVYAAALLTIALRRQMRWLRFGALALLVFGTLKVIFIDIFFAVDGRSPLLNQTFIAFLALIAAIAWSVHVYSRAEGISEKERAFSIAAFIGVANLLAIFALSFEANSYFNRALSFQENNSENWRELALAQQLSLSVIWAIYGGIMLAFGFWRRNKMLRLMGLGLLVLTIIKVFLIDLSSLDKIYRIASFVVLGAILLIVSFLYQRSQKRTAEGNP
jgi:uncharacterized membrane protein